MTSSDQNQPAVRERDLEQVRELFQAWREKRKQGTRIPAELWQAATQLFPRYTVNRISRALHLRYEDVRDRVKNHQDDQTKELRFWEFRLSELQGSIGECRVRAEDGSGRRMELELKSVGAGQLVQLLGSLWGEGT